MQFLYPCDPFDRKKPDEAYSLEWKGLAKTDTMD